MLRRFIDGNIALSRRMDALLWPSMAVDGNQSFVSLVRSAVGDDLAIADVGGGKSPLFSPQDVARKRVSVLGVDIDRSELDAAPSGAYDRVVCADITRHRGDESADVVIVQSLLEHVADNMAGMKGIASLCKPGGRVFTFCPNRRAWFATINRMLPERVKRALLHTIYPHTREKQGFPAFYDRCTPRELKKALESAGLEVDRIDCYYVSSYFMFFFPLYLVWRLVNVPLMKLWPMSFCETFVIRASKPGA
jgi:2-polyprenyl-6-hydroxyphenyl methylase/3-demethylubiquinone-9 3-methyltransferase